MYLIPFFLPFKIHASDFSRKISCDVDGDIVFLCRILKTNVLAILWNARAVQRTGRVFTAERYGDRNGGNVPNSEIIFLL